MKKQLVFIHGGEAYSNYEDFLEYLRTQEITLHNEPSKRWHKDLVNDLGNDWEVIKPAMPNSENSKYEEWKIWFERHFDFLQEEVVLIGHSQGGMFLTKYLIENSTPFNISKLFLVGSIHDSYVPFNGSLEDGGDFGFDAEKVPALADKVKKIYILHSKDDFIVPFEQGEALAKALPNAEFMVFEDKNHFLIEEFPELIQKIKGL